MAYSDSKLLDTIVGELVLLDGQRQSGASHLVALTPPRRAHVDRRHEALFVFLDLGGGGAGGLARAMLERFTQTYWHHPGTVTTVLREAINAANAHMLEENRLLPVGQRRRGGIVCAVLRNDNLYVAQVGPTEALLAQGDRVVRFPSEPGKELPLGVSAALDIRFAHRYLNVGDMFALTGQSWRDGWPEDALPAALDATARSAEQVALALERQAREGAASALIVECVLGESSEPLALLTGRDEPAVAPVREGRAYQSQPARYDEPVAAQEFEPRAGRQLSDLSGAVRSASERLGRVGKGLRQAGLALGDGARTLLTRVLPEPEPDLVRRRARGGRTPVENVPMMAGIAVAIPLLVAFVVVTFYLQRSADARRESLTNQAQAAHQAAQEAGPEEARARWTAALQAAQEALEAAPDDDELVVMRDQARAQLDALGNIVRPELIQLEDYGGGGGYRLAATRLQVYVLDTDQNQVTQHMFDQAQGASQGEEPHLVAYRGESVGDQEIGALRDVAWLEAGGARASDALLILAQDNRVLQYSLSWGLSWVPLETGLAHVDAQLLDTYRGNLYALDREQNQIWRFPSAGNGFGAPDGYFAAAAPDLGNAIDMAIDGAVYILVPADDPIYKFLAGEAQVFQLDGLPQPLSNPVAIVAEGDATSGALYVADADLRAIVALTKSGQFIHQIQAPGEGEALANLSALAIEERNRTLYLMAGGRLFALALPPLPELSD